MAELVQLPYVPNIILAAGPKTKAPPPLPVIRSTRSPPKVPILPVPSFPTTAPMIIPPPALIPRSPIQSVDELSSQSQGGHLLPYVPTPYELVANGQLTVVVPKVSQTTLPTVIPIPRTASPPLQSRALRHIPTAPIIASPALMVGETPPINEKPYVIPRTTIQETPRGILVYSSPVDIHDYAISQESAPLPLEETQQPVILTESIVPTPIPLPQLRSRELRAIVATAPTALSLPVAKLPRVPRVLAPKMPLSQVPLLPQAPRSPLIVRPSIPYPSRM